MRPAWPLNRTPYSAIGRLPPSSQPLVLRRPSANQHPHGIQSESRENCTRHYRCAVGRCVLGRPEQGCRRFPCGRRPGRLGVRHRHRLGRLRRRQALRHPVNRSPVTHSRRGNQHRHPRHRPARPQALLPRSLLIPPTELSAPGSLRPQTRQKADSNRST